MKTLALCLSILMFSVVARADNFSGKWVIESAGRRGRVQRTVLVLNQTGQKVTGTVSGQGNPWSASPIYVDIHDGKVDGATISFYVWKGTDQPWKEYYKGVLSGENIKFTITNDQPTGGQPAPGRSSGPVQETAKRSQ